MNIQQFFLDGGFGMFPTLALGATAFVLALRHAMLPKPEIMPLIVGFGLATLLSGGLGLVTGLVATLKFVQQLPPVQQGPVVMIGIGESLANAVLALALATLVALAAGVGGYRARLATA